MGITRFYGKYIKQLQHSYKNLLLVHPPQELAGVLFDMNSILHSVAQEVFGYGPAFKDNTSLQELLDQSSKEELTLECFITVCKTLERLLKKYKPQEYVVFAVDGLAPYAKINQQRQRRFRASLEHRGGRFDTCNITPATQFMIDFDVYFRKWIQISNEKHILPETTVYFSHMTPGEGEHKLYQYLRENKSKFEHSNHLVYGADADLMMLGLINPVENIYIHRDDLDNVINIKAYREGLQKEFHWANSSHLFHDYVFLMYLIGNDFLPHLLTCHDLEIGLNHMLSNYRTFDMSLTKNGHVIWSHVHAFIQILVRDEKRILKDIYVKTRGSEHRLKDFSKTGVITEDVLQQKPTYHLDMEEFRHAYHQSHSLQFYDKPNPMEIAKTYLKGMEWALSYYQHGSEGVDWEFHYPYYYPPLLCDMEEYLSSQGVAELQEREHVDRRNPMNVYHQLLMVVPPKSFKNVLPENLHAIAKELYDFYPSSFTIDRQLTVVEHQGVCLLPSVSIHFLLDFYSRSAPLPHDVLLVRRKQKQPYVDDKKHKPRPLAKDVSGEVYSDFYPKYESTVTYKENKYEETTFDRSYDKPFRSEYRKSYDRTFEKRDDSFFSNRGRGRGRGRGGQSPLGRKTVYTERVADF